MKISNNQHGFGAILVIVIIGIVSGVGFLVYSSQHNTKSGNNAVDKSHKPNTFSECLKAGGQLQYINIPKGSGSTQPDIDNSFGTVHCEYPKTPPIFPEVDDTLCNDKQKCLDIQQAAQGICDKFAPGNNFIPTFKYYPVVKANFARLYLTDCSPAHLKNDIVVTLILKTEGEHWQIFKDFTSPISCSEVDKLGIPLELVDACWQ